MSVDISSVGRYIDRSTCRASVDIAADILADISVDISTDARPIRLDRHNVMSVDMSTDISVEGFVNYT